MRDHYPRFVGSRRFPGSQQVQSAVPSQTPDAGMPPISGAYFDVANRATFQPDIAQFEQLRRHIGRGGKVAPIGDYKQPRAKDEAVKRTINACRSIKIAAANVPQRIMQQTLERQSMEIGNLTGNILFVSFGAPPAFCAGFPMQTNTMLSRNGETCPVDEIWVTSSVTGGVVAAYEGKTAWLSDQSEHW
jgi:hypothetical protein